MVRERVPLQSSKARRHFERVNIQGPGRDVHLIIANTLQMELAMTSDATILGSLGSCSMAKLLIASFLLAKKCARKSYHEPLFMVILPNTGAARFRSNRRLKYASDAHCCAPTAGYPLQLKTPYYPTFMQLIARSADHHSLAKLRLRVVAKTSCSLPTCEDLQRASLDWDAFPKVEPLSRTNLSLTAQGDSAHGAYQIYGLIALIIHLRPLYPMAMRPTLVVVRHRLHSAPLNCVLPKW